jgi:hypothetical protein
MTAAEQFAVGAKVYLRAGRNAGEPGTVIRVERGRMVIFWADLDYWSRHRPESLELAEDAATQASWHEEAASMKATLTKMQARRRMYGGSS